MMCFQDASNHPSSIALVLIKVTGELAPIPADLGREAGRNPHRSVSDCRLPTLNTFGNAFYWSHCEKRGPEAFLDSPDVQLHQSPLRWTSTKNVEPSAMGIDSDSWYKGASAFKFDFWQKQCAPATALQRVWGDASFRSFQPAVTRRLWPWPCPPCGLSSLHCHCSSMAISFPSRINHLQSLTLAFSPRAANHRLTTTTRWVVICGVAHLPPLDLLSKWDSGPLSRRFVYFMFFHPARQWVLFFPFFNCFFFFVPPSFFFPPSTYQSTLFFC